MSLKALYIYSIINYYFKSIMIILFIPYYSLSHAQIKLLLLDHCIYQVIEYDDILWNTNIHRHQNHYLLLPDCIERNGIEYWPRSVLLLSLSLTVNRIRHNSGMQIENCIRWFQIGFKPFVNIGEVFCSFWSKAVETLNKKELLFYFFSYHNEHHKFWLSQMVKQVNYHFHFVLVNVVHWSPKRMN